MTQASETGANYISLDEIKQQLAIDEGLSIHDTRLKFLIGVAIDWAQNYTQRSLGELLELDSPSDSSARPLPNPVDSPSLQRFIDLRLDENPEFDMQFWTPDQWRRYWANNPIQMDASMPLRRDVKQAIMLKVEVLFDRNIQNMKLLEDMAETMLFPYRIAMGV